MSIIKNYLLVLIKWSCLNFSNHVLPIWSLLFDLFWKVVNFQNQPLYPIFAQKSKYILRRSLSSSRVFNVYGDADDDHDHNGEFLLCYGWVPNDWYVSGVDKWCTQVLIIQQNINVSIDLLGRTRAYKEM